MIKIPVRNMLAKILAFVLAGTLWLYVMNEQNPPIESGYTVPVAQRNLAADLVVFNDPGTVKVRLRGPRSFIAGISTSDVRSYVDLTGLGEGEHPVRMQVVPQAGVEVLSIDPDKAVLVLEKVVSRQILLEVQAVGALSPEFTITNAAIKPTVAVLTGPRRFVDMVARVVGFVDITNKTGDISGIVNLRALNREGNAVDGVAIKPNQGDAVIKVAQKQETVTIEVKPIIYGELPSGFRLNGMRANPEKVSISGIASEVSNISYIYTEPINITGLTMDTTIETQLHLKEGITSPVHKINVVISVSRGIL